MLPVYCLILKTAWKYVCHFGIHLKLKTKKLCDSLFFVVHLLTLFKISVAEKGLQTAYSFTTCFVPLSVDVYITHLNV
jgi:hypothetical protein